MLLIVGLFTVCFELPRRDTALLIYYYRQHVQKISYYFFTQC